METARGRSLGSEREESGSEGACPRHHHSPAVMVMGMPGTWTPLMVMVWSLATASVGGPPANAILVSILFMRAPPRWFLERFRRRNWGGRSQRAERSLGTGGLYGFTVGLVSGRGQAGRGRLPLGDQGQRGGGGLHHLQRLLGDLDVSQLRDNKRWSGMEVNYGQE
ncbi:hypothetical protein CRUP_001077 [Coryphaenoides rupestris]|nr:hypothetical protein CRUP_001077 [Coryphaenoides rupestris]